jgi:hypothetical protein
MSEPLFADLNGSNCLVGGMAAISFSSTEDINADYAMATAVCMGGEQTKGSEVEVVIGGVSLGEWVIDDWRIVQSGPETWRRPQGGTWGHIPMVQMTLRRKGWLEARATLSKSVLGSDRYPPKFCTADHYEELREDAQERVNNKEIHYTQMLKELGSWIVVNSGREIIQWICGLVGLSVTFRSACDCVAPEYLPVSKTAMAACREVASWSGGDCYLARDGSLIVYDFNEVFNRGQRCPTPVIVTKEEWGENIAYVNQCTVVGSGPVRYWEPPEPPHWRPPGGDPTIPAYDPGYPGYWRTGAVRAVEVTESYADGFPTVEQRIEINEYDITPAVASKIAKSVLAKAALASYYVSYTGPGMGSQTYEPVNSACFAVKHNLTWNGTAYRYFVIIEGSRATVPFGGGTSTTGWW